MTENDKLLTEVDKLQRWGPIVARCRSARDPSVTYEVRRHQEKGSYSCNCGGYGPRGCCKHTKAAEATEGRSGIVELGRDGRQLVMRQQSVKGEGILRSALDEMQGKVRDAVRAEAEKAIAAAARPVLILGRREVLKPARRSKRDRVIDPIRAEAAQVVATLSSWGSLPVRVDLVVALVDAAIRKFVGSAPATLAMPIMQAERGVREIILSDD